MNRAQLNRRRFLKAVGATALTYPFLRSLPSYAAPATDPQYLVLIYTPCGVVRYLWGAQGPARPTTGVLASPLTGATGTGAFRATLMPLTAGATDLTSQTILLDGLNVGTANGSHEAGMAALWTGCYNSGNPATSISIDQAIAPTVSAGRSFPTIPLMVRSSQDFSDREVKTRMLYSAGSGGTVGYVDPIDDPVQARGTIFPNLPSSSAASGPDKKTFIRGKIFAQMNTELTALQSRLCTQDRLQLQNIQTAWNDLNTQISQAATAAASCSAPESAPAGYVAPSIDFPTSAKLQMDILALALACDLTRVGSLQFSTATSQVTHTWIDSTQTAIHHQYSHDGPSSLYSLGADLYNNVPSYVSSAYAPQLSSIDLWYAQQVAYFGQKLASLNTSSGKNLLSQSIVCWGSELDMGAAHNHDDSPFVILGGGGGKLKSGQLVQFPLNLPGNAPATNNRFHNDLLVTLAQAMGVSMSTFGSTSGTLSNNEGMATFNAGPITQILA